MTDWVEAQQAFYAWEQKTYGNNTPLSDYDKEIWIQGYLTAKGVTL